MIRLDVVDIREEFISRTVTEEVDVATEVPVKVGVKDPETGEIRIETRMETRIGKQQVKRLIQEPKVYIEYAAPGRRAYATTVKTLGEIKAIEDADPNGEDSDDRTVEAGKRDFLLAYYDSWKKGHEMPETGIPLGAWPAINTKIAEMFRASGIRTVEEVAELTEQAKSRLGHIGNLGDLIKQAKLYIGSADKLATASHMKSLEEQNAALKDELAEQQAMLKEMQAMLIEMKQQAPGASAKPKRASAEAAA